jgi:hypothetical protein
MKKTLASLLAGLMIVVSVPFLLLADTDAAGKDPCVQAREDVVQDLSGAKFLWMGAGCLASIFAVGAGFMVAPDVPEKRTMGKSSKYVEEYTYCYKDASKPEQWLWASLGCAVNFFAFVIIYGVMAAIKYS